MKQDMIVILDLGSTENTVLARQIRALGVYSEIYPHDITAEELKALPNVKGVIIYGGPNNIVDGERIDVNHEIYECGYPVMAVAHELALCSQKLEAFPEDEEKVMEILKKFVFEDCKAEANWNMKNFIEDQVEVIGRGIMVRIVKPVRVYKMSSGGSQTGSLLVHHISELVNAARNVHRDCSACVIAPRRPKPV